MHARQREQRRHLRRADRHAAPMVGGVPNLISVWMLVQAFETTTLRRLRLVRNASLNKVLPTRMPVWAVFARSMSVCSTGKFVSALT
jgi:hypothetical protein